MSSTFTAFYAKSNALPVTAPVTPIGGNSVTAIPAPITIDPAVIDNPTPSYPVVPVKPLKLFSGINYTGDSIELSDSIQDLSAFGFNDRSLSAMLTDARETMIFNATTQIAGGASFNPLAGTPITTTKVFTFFAETQFKGAAYMMYPGRYPDIFEIAGRTDFSSILMTPLGIGPATATQTQIAGGCFSGNTQILMLDGSTKNIKDMKRNDAIVTLDIPSFPKSDHFDTYKDWWTFDFSFTRSSGFVREVRGRPFHYSYVIVFDGGQIDVTVEHPILVRSEGVWRFKRVHDIRSSDLLHTLDGDRKIIGIEIVREPQVFWNLDVEGFNIYFANGVAAHNASALSNLTINVKK